MKHWADKVSEKAFVSIVVPGTDGAVRSMFATRDLQIPAAAKKFPGIRTVAISTKRFSDSEKAIAWLEERARASDNAVAVALDGGGNTGQWLVGAWVADQ